jgi:uncharacterized membrane protein
MAQGLMAQAGEASSSVYLWTIVLLVVVLLLFGAVAWARKRLSPNEEFHGEGFTLSDLRRMHKEGKLTEEEFERAKAKMVAAMHAAQARQEAARAEAAKRGSM